MKKAEDRVQQEIVFWFRNTYCTKLSSPRCSIFSVPNERKNTRELMQLMQMGLLPGVSDLIVCVPSRVIFVEVKTETGTQQQNQRDFQEVITRLGLTYILVRSLEDFQQQISPYLP